MRWLYNPVMTPTSLIGLAPTVLKAALLESGAAAETNAAMRASQVWNWLYVRGERDFAKMTNLSKDLRAQLAGSFSQFAPRAAQRKWSTRLVVLATSVDKRPKSRMWGG